MLRRQGLRSFVCAWSCAFFSSLASLGAAEIELFVSPIGNDQAAGTAQEPLATPAGAQQRLRELRSGDQADAIAHVWLGAGVYELEQPLEFTADDNSPSGAATTYAALPGQEVILRGGRTITIQNLSVLTCDIGLPSSARPHVRMIDLDKLPAEPLDTHHRSRARHKPMQPLPLELFAGKQRLPTAGWPNTGWAKVSRVQPDQLSWQVPRELDLGKHLDGAMVHGFWSHDWQDSCQPVQVQQSSTGDRLFHIAPDHAQHVEQIREGARYRLENLPSQLDQPGEWYLDQSAQRAYLWPTAEMEGGELFASTLDTPVSIYDAHNLTLRGLTIEGARASCVEIAGGQHVCLDSCLIRHAGNLGINIFHGQQHRVINCEVTSTGAGAIRVEGGERETLQACDHVIENCRLHDYAQLQLAYRPGVNVYGVGISIVGNEIFDAPHAAVVLHGNEHRVLRNHIHHVCRETDDVGAIYLGHNPTFRGNQILRNYLHDLGGFSQLNVIGIYLDDFASGTAVTHNLLVRAGRGVAIGGGRDNLVDNNLFIDCLAAVQIDNRGQTWARHYHSGEDAYIARCYQEVNAAEGVFADQYPELATMLDDQPELAKGNRITRNLFEGQIGIDLHDGLNSQTVQLEHNHGQARQAFVNLDAEDYRIQPGSIADTIGFEAVGPGKVVFVSQ